MAVESQNLCFFPSNLIIPNGFPAPAPPDDLLGGGDLGDMQLAVFNDVGAPASIGFTAAAPPPDSGLAPFCASGRGVPSKRQRSAVDASSSFFLGDEVASCLMRQQVEIDRLISQHVERMRSEMAARWGRISWQMLAAVEDRVARRMRAKEEEAERIAKLNWGLEERIRSLSAENQIWRDLARSSEAAADVLRCNLQQVLLAAEIDDGGAGGADAPCASAASVAEDEASSSVFFFRDGEEEVAKAPAATRMCRRCGRRESAVLLLPCRHLCVCAGCSPATDACPVCKSNKDGSVVVNMS